MPRNRPLFRNETNVQQRHRRAEKSTNGGRQERGATSKGRVRYQGKPLWAGRREEGEVVRGGEAQGREGEPNKGHRRGATICSRPRRSKLEPERNPPSQGGRRSSVQAFTQESHHRENKSQKENRLTEKGAVSFWKGATTEKGRSSRVDERHRKELGAEPPFTETVPIRRGKGEYAAAKWVLCSVQK